jgi:hypothetical protein
MNEWFERDLQVWMNRYIRRCFFVNLKFSLCLTNEALQQEGIFGQWTWSSVQSSWLQIQKFRVRFPALPDFLTNSGSGTGSTGPREYN